MSVKNLEIKSSILFNLVFAKKFCFFFLITDLKFLIPAVIGQILIPTAEFSIHTGIATKEAKAEMETHRVIVGAKISRCSIEVQVQVFLCFFLVIISLYFDSSKGRLLVPSIFLLI